MNEWLLQRNILDFHFETLILISLPYFVAVIAVVIYANKQIKKIGNIVEDKEDWDKDDNTLLGDQG